MSSCLSIEGLFRDKNWQEMANVANARFGTGISGQELHKVAKKKMPSGGWENGTWLSWLKNRLAEITSFPVSECRSDEEIRFTCELHVGFVQIEETGEMISRLHNEKVVDESYEARSKLNKNSSVVIGPVDRVAARVV